MLATTNMGRSRNNRGNDAATTAVGSTVREQLAWLVNFFQRKNELATAEPATIRQMTAELARFAQSNIECPDLKLSELEKLMDELGTDFCWTLLVNDPDARAVADLGNDEQPIWLIERSSQDKPFKFVRVMRLDSQGRVQTRYLCDDLVTAARWRAQDLIVPNCRLIRYCPRRRCHRFFVIRHGRQQFCSKNCEQVERNARWRRQHPEKARVLRHLAYERQLARKHAAAKTEPASDKAAGSGSPVLKRHRQSVSTP